MSLRRALSFASAMLLASCLSSDPLEDGGGATATNEGGGSAGSPSVIADGANDSDGAASSNGGAPSEGGSTSSTICGDSVCGIDETCDNCPDDCSCSPQCGDGICDANEACEDCPGDCGTCAVCGDGTCDATEDCGSCYQDCGICPCMADAFEPNQGSPTATPVMHGVDYCDLSVCSGDVDWLAFSVTNSFTATLTFFQAEGDLELEIYSDVTGQYVSGSYSSDDDESVTLTNQTPGTYWARIYGDNAENPAYCFRVD